MELVKKDLVQRLLKSMGELFTQFETPLPNPGFTADETPIEAIDLFLEKCRLIARKHGFDGLILNYFASYLERDLTISEFTSGIEHVLKPMQGRKALRRSRGLREWIPAPAH